MRPAPPASSSTISTPERGPGQAGWDIDSSDEFTPDPRGSFLPLLLSRRAWFTKGDTDDLYSMTLWDPATGAPGAASYYYSTDHLGSVRALTDDAGTVVADLDTDSYGNPEASVETIPQPFRFTGREYDRSIFVARLRQDLASITTATANTTQPPAASCKRIRSSLPAAMPIFIAQFIPDLIRDLEQPTELHRSIGHHRGG